MEDLYLRTLRTRLEGWQPVLYYVSHSLNLIGHFHPGDGGSYDIPFTDQLPPQPPYSVCQKQMSCGPHKSMDLTKAEVLPKK